MHRQTLLASEMQGACGRAHALSQHAVMIRDEDKPFCPAIGDTEACVRRVRIGNIETRTVLLRRIVYNTMHAQKSLPCAAPFVGFTRSVPIERDAKRFFSIAWIVHANGRAIGAKRLIGMCRIKFAVKNGKIADPFEREWSLPDLLKVRAEWKVDFAFSV